MPALGFCAVGAQRRWNGGERPARPGPHFLGRNGGKNPRGRRFLPRDPLLWWGCVGEAVLLTGYLACGPHTGRPVTARPPAGRAGDVGRYPLGEGREEPFGFPAFSSRQQTTSPARPSWWAGRGVGLRGRRPGPYLTEPPSPVSPTREWGSKGKEPPSPWCSFPYFFKEIGPRPGGPRSRPFQRRGGRTPQRPLPVPHSHNQSN